MRSLAIAAAIVLTNVGIAGGNGPTTFSFEDVVMTTCNDREVNIAIGPSGTVCVVYYEDNGCGNCNGDRGLLRFTQRPNGAGWIPPQDVTRTASHVTQLALGVGETPYVSYSGIADTTERVRYFDGTSWIDLGLPLPSGCIAQGGMGGAVVANAQGVVGLAYFDGCEENAVYARWDGPASLWNPFVVESQDRVGKAMCCFLNPAGLPVLSYLNQDTYTARVAEPTSQGAWFTSSPQGAYDPSDIDLLPTGELLLLVRATNQQPPLELFTGGLAVGGIWTPDPSFPGAPYSLGKAAVDPTRGTVHVLGMEWSQSRIDYLCNSGNGWVVSPVTMNGRGGDIALDAQGHVMIAFVRANGVVCLATEVCTGDVTTYCTAKVNSLGCTPAVGSSGTPSATSQSPFLITASNVVDNKAGIFFYGTSGRNAFTGQCPWSGGGVLCVQPALKRTPVQMSGGAPWSCEGGFSIDFNVVIQSGVDPNLVAGTQVNGQYWFRDPQAICTTGTTNAIEFTVCN